MTLPGESCPVVATEPRMPLTRLLLAVSPATIRPSGGFLNRHTSGMLTGMLTP